MLKRMIALVLCMILLCAAALAEGYSAQTPLNGAGSAKLNNIAVFINKRYSFNMKLTVSFNRS